MKVNPERNMRDEILEFEKTGNERKEEMLLGRNAYPIFEIWPWNRYHFCSLHLLLAFGRAIVKALVYKCLEDTKEKEGISFLEELEELEIKCGSQLSDIDWSKDKEKIRVFCRDHGIEYYDPNKEKTLECIFSFELIQMRSMNENRKKQRDNEYAKFDKLQTELRKKGINVYYLRYSPESQYQ